MQGDLNELPINIAALHAIIERLQLRAAVPSRTLFRALTWAVAEINSRDRFIAEVARALDALKERASLSLKDGGGDG